MEEGKSSGANTSVPARTAILVIHGIGEQNPLETLDSFVRGMAKFLSGKKIGVKMAHNLASRTNPDGGQWTESYIALDSTAGHRLDIHECYWADLAEEQISSSEVLMWLWETFTKTRKFRKENTAMLSNNRRDPEFALLRLLAGQALVPLLAAVAALVALVAILCTSLLPEVKAALGGLLALFSLNPKILAFSKKLLKKFFKGASAMVLEDYLGDVTIYTTTDEKNKHFKIRRRILGRAQCLLEDLMRDERYDRVIVAGHSLGSVISYDLLNRINIRGNMEAGQGVPPEKRLPLGKIGGLITFGSPLDKIAYFFREQTEKNSYVRRQMIDHLHSFKAKGMKVTDPNKIVERSIQRMLEHIDWVNYWCKADPVSGYLDFYNMKDKDKDNVELELASPFFGAAHVKYWDHDPMYDSIFKRFLGWPAQPPPHAKD